MSASNGVIRIGKKGLRKFAFGEEGEPFEIDVVATFQQWIIIDEEFRSTSDDKTIPTAEMPAYHRAAQEFIKELSKSDVSVGEAFDFLARLREEYDELASFFQPRSRPERGSPVTSEVELRFSEEGTETG